MKKNKMNTKHMITTIHKATTLGLVLLFLSATALKAQQKEVMVVKPYSPTLSTADKIQLLPSMDEEVELDIQDIDYKLYPKRYPSVYEVDPIRAARMVPVPLKRLYRTELNMGFGNYLTPLIDLRINQLRSRKGTFGFYFRHHSMNGKIKLDNELKAPAGFNKNKLGITGSRFMKKTSMDYHAGVAYNSYVHYGVDTSLNTVLDRANATHGYFLAHGGLKLYSMHNERYKIKFKTSLDYHFFTHAFVENEHVAKLNFSFTRELRILNLGGDACWKYRNHQPWNTGAPQRSVFLLSPYVSKGNEQWKFMAGFNFYGDMASGTFKPYISPRALFTFHMVEEIIVPYFELNGKFVTHPLRQIVEENPYITPATPVRPTNHKLIAKIGVRGRLTDGMAYHLLGSYSIIDDDYFWVNDLSTAEANQFLPVSDDVTLARLHGELTFRPSGSWKVFLKGNYYSYTTVSLAEAWYKPRWDAGIQGRYNMAEKIIVNTGLQLVGSRPYQLADLSTDRLPAMVDANLGVEYRYTSLLSFWAKIDNLAAQRYYMFYQYPSYRFRMMLGFTYAL